MAFERKRAVRKRKTFFCQKAINQLMFLNPKVGVLIDRLRCAPQLKGPLAVLRSARLFSFKSHHMFDFLYLPRFNNTLHSRPFSPRPRSVHLPRIIWVWCVTPFKLLDRNFRHIYLSVLLATGGSKILVTKFRNFHKFIEIFCLNT